MIELSRSALEHCGCEWLGYGCKADGSMKTGPSASLLAAAGPELQDALRQGLTATTRQLGEVVETPGFQACRGIFHLVALVRDLEGRWVSQPEPLARGLERVLARCDELGVVSLGLSALGATKLTIGPERTARFMLEAARRHPGLRVVFSLPDPNVYAAFLRARSH